MDNDKRTLRYPNVLYRGTEELTLEEQEEINAIDEIVYGALFDAFAKIKDPTIKFSDKPVTTNVHMPSGSVLKTYVAPMMNDELAAEVLEKLHDRS